MAAGLLTTVHLSLTTISYAAKAQAMQGARAVAAQRRQVLGGAITLVLSKTISRIKLMISAHQPIAMHFCHNRGRSNGKTALVPFGNAFLGDGQGELVRTVD